MKIPPSCAAVLAVAASAVGQPAAPSPEPRALPTCPDVVGRVNGRPITRAQLRLKGTIASLHDPAVLGNLDDAYHNGMNELVRRELVFEDAEAHHFSAEPEAVDAVEKDLRADFSDEKALDAFLAALGVDRAWLRREAFIQETARAYAGCVAEEEVPVASEQDALFFYRAYNPGAPDPSGPELNSWRQQVTRNKRNMALREQMDRLFAKAKDERFYMTGQCAP
jgi:hypothetical protein